MGILKGSPAKSTSGSAQQWAQPYATQGAQDVIDVFNAAQPQTQANLAAINAANANLGKLGGQLAGQTAGMGQQAAAMGKTAGSANNFYGDVINGKYMSGNPYIQNMLGQLDQSILGQVGSQFESGGRYGSGAYVDDLSKQLGNANMQVLYGNYADEMNRRMQAGQQADQALAAQQNALNNSEQQQNNNAMQQLAGLQLANQAPYTGVTALGNSLGALFNGGTSTGQKPGLLDYLMQAGSNAASAFAGGA
jgi:hypothetical protein